MLVFTLLSMTAALVAQASPIAEKRQLGGCKKVYLIHARGTSEPGELGMLVGTPFSAALGAKFPGQFGSAGVRYSADWGGAISGAMNPTGQSGAKQMAKMAKDMMGKCPETKIVLGGYSQGAEQVHGALKILGTDAARIGAAVTFGDPMNMGIVAAAGPLLGGWGSLPSSRAKVFCYPGDPVCGGIGISHLSYASSAGEAASFVAKALGSMGGGGGSSSALSSIAAKGKGGDSGSSMAAKGKGGDGGSSMAAKGKGDSGGAKGKGGDSSSAKGKESKGSSGLLAKLSKGKDTEKSNVVMTEDVNDAPLFVMDS